MNFSALESAFAAEAAAHAAACFALNSYGEAECVELGSARLVYSGSFSPTHGVFGLGLDGPVEERDFLEIDRFFTRKERPAVYWVTSFTDPSLREYLRHGYRAIRTELVRGVTPSSPKNLPADPFLSGPDHGAWSLGFAKALDPAAKEPNLLAVTKLHQKNTRFYLAEGGASYTFFHQGIALVPHPHPATWGLQLNEAAGFHCKSMAAIGGGDDIPFLYERILYEPV